MGAKFESEAVITGSIQNKKQFIVQQTQAHVAFLSEKAENCFVDASLSALFQLSVGDRVVLEATKANQKYNFSFTTLKIIEKIYCSKQFYPSNRYCSAQRNKLERTNYQRANGLSLFRI